MGRMAKMKGIRGELQVRDLCRENGFTSVQRGGQAMFQRGSEIADVVGLPGIHIECKNVERLNYRQAMEQSIRDCEQEGAGNLPILAHKSNRKPWLITMRASDWFKLYKGYRASLWPF